MKIITIQKTLKGGYVATVNGFISSVCCFGKNEIEALKHLVEKLEEKNPRFIQRSDWTWNKENEK